MLDDHVNHGVNDLTSPRLREPSRRFATATGPHAIRVLPLLRSCTPPLSSIDVSPESCDRTVRMPVHRDDHRPVNANEPFRVELVLGLLHRAAPEMCLRPDMEAEVVVGHVQPIDLVGRHDVVRVAAPNDEPGAEAARALGHRRTGHERLAVVGRAATEPLLRASHGGANRWRVTGFCR